MKTCSKCSRLMPIECFAKNCRRKDGVMGMCKECRNAKNAIANKAYADRNRESIRASQRARYHERDDLARERDRANRARKKELQRLAMANAGLLRPRGKYAAHDSHVQAWRRAYELHMRNAHDEHVRRRRRMEQARAKWQRAKGRETVRQGRIRRRKAYRDEAQDRYVVQLLVANGPLRAQNIPRAMIEAKRLELLIRRQLRKDDENN